MIIYNAKQLSQSTENILKQEVEKLPRKPKLVVIKANDDASSALYVSNKTKACTRVGIDTITYNYEPTATHADIASKITELNNREDVDGILLQLPLYPHLQLYADELLQSISPNKDVDCFTYKNLGKMLCGNGTIKPLTAKGVVDILKDANIDMIGKHVVVLGRSIISGRSIAELLLKENATVTITHSLTENLDKYTLDADIIIACVGKANILRPHQVKDGVVLVNVGFSKVGDKTYGDIDFQGMVDSGKPSFITTTFNSTGTMTVTNLLETTIECAKNNLK